MNALWRPSFFIILWLVALEVSLWSPDGDAAQRRPIPARDIPERILLGGRDVLIARVGKEFFERCLSLDSAHCVYWVDATAPPKSPRRHSSGAPDTLATPVGTSPPSPGPRPDRMDGVRWSLTYHLRVPTAPWVRENVWFDVDSAGGHVGARGFMGLSDCAHHPEECTFSISELAARDIARMAGLKAGIKPWTVSFQWWEAAPESCYVWKVSSTLKIDPNGLSKHGESIAIDASTGQVKTILGRKFQEWSDWWDTVPDVASEKHPWWR